jgi:hypothetical protein
MPRALLKDSLLERLRYLFFKFPPQAYVEARHTLLVSPYNLSKCVYPLFS